MSQKIKYWKALNNTIREEMYRDESVCIFGEDTGLAGGAFGATRGLQNEFGSLRVKDTPISEAAIAGIAVGASISGIRPIGEIMFSDFMTLAMDQIINHAAKISHMTNGKVNVPMTILTACAAGRNSGSQHTQSLEALISHIPGLKVVWPATPADVKGLLTSAIRDNNPVIVIYTLGMLTKKGDVPEGEYIIPIGKADIKRQGKDISIITFGSALQKAEKAADIMDEKGISTEIVDVRSLNPIDEKTIIESVSKTKRAVIVHDAVEQYGIGAEISARINSELFGDLKAPIQRVAATFTPPTFSPELSKGHYPQVEQIISTVNKVMNFEREMTY